MKIYRLARHFKVKYMNNMIMISKDFEKYVVDYDNTEVIAINKD